MSIVIHEVAHGYSAYLLGDNTAKDEGRLTLNPIKHLDPFGSVILPLMLVLLNTGFFIGWAKPVPYNPRNLKNGRMGDLIVSISGILTNLAVAIFFGLLMNFAPALGLTNILSDGGQAFYQISSMIVIVNLVLALFNLVPIPPLDGSKILFSILPLRFAYIQEFLEKWGFPILVIFIVFGWKFVAPLVFVFFKFLTGVDLVM